MSEGKIGMKLQRVIIDGFKNLNNVNVLFDDITALISINNFGKSNFLKGISFGISFIKANENVKNKMLMARNFLPFNISNYGKKFSFEIEATTELVNDSYIICYSFVAKWGINSPDEAVIEYESLKIKCNSKPHQKFETIIKRTNEECIYKTTETGRCSTKISIERLNLAVNKLKSFDNLYYVDLLKEINNITLYMEDTIDPRSFYNPDPVILKGVGDVMFRSNNLPRVLYKIKESTPDKYELIENTFKELFRNVEDLKLQEFKVDYKGPQLPDDLPYTILDSLYRLSVKDKFLSGPIDFEEMSDGAKRILILLTRIVLANMSKVSLIAIEEPENSIHPSLLNAYIQVISNLLDGCKLIFTSHSPYLISYLLSHGIYAGISDGEGGAQFKKINPEVLYKDAKEVETQVGDYLFQILADDDDELLRKYIGD